VPSMDKVSGEEFRGDDGVGRESGIMERHSDATRMVRPCVILEEGGGGGNSVRLCVWCRGLCLVVDCRRLCGSVWLILHVLAGLQDSQPVEFHALYYTGSGYFLML